MSVYYTLCSRCGIKVPPTRNPDRLCRDCVPWRNGHPTVEPDPEPLEALPAGATPEERAAHRRRYMSAYMRASRARQRLAEQQSPAYHTAYLERFDLRRLEQERSS